MNRNKVFCCLFLAALLWACSPSTPEPLSPELIIENCVSRMEAIDSFHFLIDRSGFPAFLDANQTLAFRKAEGDFQAPDRASATVRVIGPGIVAEIDIISVAENQWETNMLSGEWQALPPNWGFNPASLFDQDVGIQSILETDLRDLQLRGNEELEELPGKLLYALEGNIDGEGLYRLSYGMMGPEALKISLYIAPETFELYRLNMVHHRPDAEEDTLWQIDFWEFDQPLNIVPPDLDEDISS
jgi:lipoprotein LprG